MVVLELFSTFFVIQWEFQCFFCDFMVIEWWLNDDLMEYRRDRHYFEDHSTDRNWLVTIVIPNWVNYIVLVTRVYYLWKGQLVEWNNYGYNPPHIIFLSTYGISHDMGTSSLQASEFQLLKETSFQVIPKNWIFMGYTRRKFCTLLAGNQPIQVNNFPQRLKPPFVPGFPSVCHG